MGLDRYSAWNCSFKISNVLKIVSFPPFVTECSYLIFSNLPGVGASYLGVRTLPRDWWCLDGVRVYREPPVLPQSPCDHLWRHILGRKTRVVMSLHGTFPKGTVLSWIPGLLDQSPSEVWKTLSKAEFPIITTDDWTGKGYWELLWAWEDVQWHPRPSLARYQQSNGRCIHKLTHAPSQAKPARMSTTTHMGTYSKTAEESGNWAATFLLFLSCLFCSTWVRRTIGFGLEEWLLVDAQSDWSALLVLEQEHDQGRDAGGCV